ncbi:MAG: hypothetical protein WAP03_24710 [Methylorubrum rhodinum]|jgi:hypothetical protein|uniref:hypothetical protein n=1 Tax=Methylorubrum rhodinum TaxID=29428 RepID=UPI001054D05E
MALPVNIISDICDVTGAWSEAFLSEVSLKRYRRACAWAMSEAAKWGAEGATDAVATTFSNPTPWMMRAFKYTRALDRAGNKIEASVSVLPSQSIVMKYAMGEGPQVRRPGDVGLARDRILVPNWRNLQLTQGINRNMYGNLPGGVAARLSREAAGTRAKRRVAGRWGVYEGEVDVGGSRLVWYIARPPRGEAPIGKNGRSIVVNLGRLRALLVAIREARYDPIMQEPYDAAMLRAVNRIPALMQDELDEAIAYRDSRPGLRRMGSGA